MELLVWGLNYKTAPLCLREKLAANVQEVEPILGHLLNKSIVSEGVILSTCNRTELVAMTNQGQEVLPWFANFLNLKENDLKPFIYHYTEFSAVQHIMRVACGLNSMILGEVEILGQIKQAYRRAKALKTLGKSLNRLFQTVFYVAKNVRTNTAIGVNPLSVATLAVKLAERIFSHLEKTNVLLIGAGDLMRLSATHFKQAGVQKMWVANRTSLRAEVLAKKVGAQTISLDLIPTHLTEVDIVITGTNSILPIIGKGMVEEALKKRKYRPILMIDLAVPRNVEPQVGSLEEVYLYCIDDLKDMVEENRKLRQNEVDAAMCIILKESETFMQWLQAQDTLTTLKAFRHKFEKERDMCVKQALSELQMGKSAEEVLKRLSHMLFNRLMHAPTMRLRRAGFYQEEDILQFTKELFELNNEII